jgi:TRAP-type C4-dicarboxylate transport system substrate-binding protein
MWDGYWLVANGRLWGRIPDALKDIIAKNIKQATMEERVTIRGLNDSVKGDLLAKGLAFNTPPSNPFRYKLTSAGFYEHWRSKFGEQTWGLLEHYTGKLS